MSPDQVYAEVVQLLRDVGLQVHSVESQLEVGPPLETPLDKQFDYVDEVVDTLAAPIGTAIVALEELAIQLGWEGAFGAIEEADAHWMYQELISYAGAWARSGADLKGGE